MRRFLREGISTLLLAGAGIVALIVLLRPGFPLPTRSPLSTLPTPPGSPPTPSPTLLPLCAPPPFPTPPYQTCPGLPTPTAYATVRPIYTPWTPPPVPAPSPHAVFPRPGPAADARGWVLIPNHREGILAVPMSADGYPSDGLFNLRLLEAGTGGERPAIFDRLALSPNHRYLVGIVETEGGDVVHVLAMGPAPGLTSLRLLSTLWPQGNSLAGIRMAFISCFIRIWAPSSGFLMWREGRIVCWPSQGPGM